MDALTIPALLRARAASTPALVAYVDLDGSRNRLSVTWGEFLSRVERVASALSALGLKAGDRVAIFARNSVDWETAQHASFVCGALVAGVDFNYPPGQLNELMGRLRPTTVFAEDTSFLERLERTVKERLKLAIVFRPGPKVASPRVLHMSEFFGSRPPQMLNWDVLDFAAGGIISFSSGTTGNPRLISFTHAQAREAISAIAGAFPDIGQGEHLLCWLPLANLFQRMLNFCAIQVGATSYVVSDPRAVMDHLSAVKPKVFIGVPRFFERLQSGISDKLSGGVWPVRQLATWALSHGHEYVRRSRANAPMGLRWAAWLADRLVLYRIRAVFGGRVKYLVSGSAPMPRWLLEWFDAIGLTVYEAYGVSEDIVPIAMNRPGQQRLGTVGKPLPLNEVRLASDGEILVRGPGVFKGYLEEAEDGRYPDEDGFWRTGDLGSFDEDRFLSIHARKYDTFKLSTGRWVSPAAVEEFLCRVPYIEHAVVVGANRKVPVALVCLKAGNPRRQPASTALAQAAEAGNRLSATGEATLAADLARVLDSVPLHERPAGVLVLDTAFSIGGGELTTNLKLRRAEVERKYAAEIDHLYESLDHLSSLPVANSQGLLVQSA